MEFDLFGASSSRRAKLLGCSELCSDVFSRARRVVPPTDLGAAMCVVFLSASLCHPSEPGPVLLLLVESGPHVVSPCRPAGHRRYLHPHRKSQLACSPRSRQAGASRHARTRAGQRTDTARGLVGGRVQDAESRQAHRRRNLTTVYHPEKGRQALMILLRDTRGGGATGRVRCCGCSCRGLCGAARSDGWCWCWCWYWYSVPVPGLHASLGFWKRDLSTDQARPAKGGRRDGSPRALPARVA